MENIEEFKVVVANINHLEQLLVLVEESAKEIEERGQEVEKEIEEHFDRCFNALAARKETLLRELGQKVTNQKKSSADIHKNLTGAIEVRRKMLETGSFVYTNDINTAKYIWKGVTNLPSPQVFTQRIEIVLSNKFYQSIQQHGKVLLGHNLQVSNSPVQDDASRYSFIREVTLFAGSGSGYLDGNGAQAKFSEPCGISRDPYNDCLYICDTYNNSIRKINSQGKVTTVHRQGLFMPQGVVINHKTNSLFVTCARTENIIQVTPSGVVMNFVGSGRRGDQDGLGFEASFYSPYGIAVNQQTGSLFVSDCYNHSIRMITSQKEVTTLARGVFKYPGGICFDERNQCLLVCDGGNDKLKRVSLKGDVSTVCDIPKPFCVVSTNTLILVASGTNKIFKVTREGIVSELRRQERRGGETKECLFNNPIGLAVDEEAHTCYVVEYLANVISKITF